MPRIPEYQRSVGITDKGPNVEQPLVNPKSYGLEQLAQSELWGQVGKAAGKTADLGFDIEEKMARAKMVDEFSNMNASYTKGLYELREAVKGGSLQQADGQTVNFSNDPSTWQKSFEEEHAKLLDKTLSMGTVPGAQLAFKRHASMIFPTQLHGVMNDSRKQTVDNVKGNLEANINIYQEMWPKAQSELERNQLWNNVDRSLEEAVATHVITPKQSELMKMHFGKYTKISDFNGALARDPLAAQEALKHPDAFGFTDKERMDAKGHADTEVKRKQGEVYENLFAQIVKNSGESGPTGPIPTEEQVKGLLKSGQLHAGQANNLLGYIAGAKHNPEKKTDPASYKEAVVRLTDPDKPLTREEFLQNVSSGAWKMSAENYSHFLTNIHNRDLNKIPKQLDAAFANRTKTWQFEFRGGPVTGKDSEEYKTGMAMVYQAKIAGEYDGMAPDEVQKQIDQVFKTQANEYLRRYHLDPETRKRQRPAAPGGGSSWYKPWTWSGGQTGQGPAGQATMPSGGSGGERPWTQGTTGIRNEGGWRGGSGIPGRAVGGPVEEGQEYLVGEQGPEILKQSGQPPQVVGKGGPEVIVPNQSGQILPNDMLQKVLDEYPGLKKVHSMDTTSAMFASPDRIAATKKAYGKEDIGGLEYWPKEETGLPGLPHPTGGKGNVLELYDEKLKSDPQELHTAILGDLLHGMPKDPGFAKMRDGFAKNFSPAAKELIKKKNCPPEARNSMIDAFIRGAMMPYKGGNWKDKDPDLYSPKQLELLKQMEQYLKEGKE